MKGKIYDREEIKRRHANGESDRKIAKAMGACDDTIFLIRNKELKLPTNFTAWKDLPPAKPSNSINPNLQRIKSTFGGGRGSRLPVIGLIKPEFLSNKGAMIHYFPIENRTEIIRFFYSIFREDLIIDETKAKRITKLLKNNKLTRAEINAVLLHLGYKYSTTERSFKTNHKNLVINGYFDGRKGIENER